METEAEKRMSGWLEVPAAGALWMLEAAALSEYDWQMGAMGLSGLLWFHWDGKVVDRDCRYRYRQREPEWIYVSDNDVVREMKAHPDDEWQVKPEGDTSWVDKTPPRRYVFLGSQYRRRPRR